MADFSKLSAYVGKATGARRFISVGENELVSAESALGFALPSDLKEFYRAVGYGWLGSDARLDVRNLFVHPLDIADLFKGQSEFSPPEGFLDGDLPFFDCGGSRFLVMRRNERDSEGIYRDNGEEVPIAENLDDFVEKLVENPTFYEM